VQHDGAMTTQEDRHASGHHRHRARGTVLHVAIDEGEGPAVVLVHGIAASSTTFQNVVPLLRDDHRVIAIDLLGFGGSPVPPDSDYSVDEHVRSLEATLATLHLPKEYVLVGHSMGALISTRLALREARRVRSLVLVAPPIYLNPAELSHKRDRGLMDLHLRAYRFVKDNPRFTLRTARLLAQILPVRHAVSLDERGWTAFVRSLENSIESQTTLADLARVAAPVDIVVGSLDEFASEEVLRIASRLTGVTTHRVIGSDHLIGRRLARVVAQAVRSAG
jgi:cis-3-alkyl-4-acyloxetan-2-one decarboxylase